MASKLILHIGLQKSGTTFLQHMLQHNAEALADAGVRYPVPADWDRGRRTVANHEWSSYGLLGTEYPWVSERRAAEEAPAWESVREQVRESPGTVLLSAEAMSVVRGPAARRLLESLGVADTEIVVTARSLGRALPSLWQQHIRNGRSTTFGGYLTGLAAHRDKGPDHVENELDAHIWRAFTLSGLARRWTDAGASRVTVVTSPGRPPELLWRRFAEAAGVPGLAEIPTVQSEGARAHGGLTAPETLVIAGLNDAMREGSWSRRSADRVRQLATERFQTRERRGAKVVVPPEWRERVAGWSREDVAALPGTGAAVIGDLGDLAYDPGRDGASAPTPEEAAAAGAEAALAFAELHLRGGSSLRRGARKIRRRLP
ncbi:hypothetical protein [Actinomadura sp. WMMB 499]|uniref:hypothetical protein n=1 Tax=Actinomadura sp. WMMB 499 TaxID=1219491 RepID=UPI00124900A7|nr:hypothetical protein [Actinomadura sp. WMMB 499]QFG20395.1 hypothetical protein F7P10_03665 [Actinomadura sp. WMMB 499]